jgi:hypothetical protein
MHNYKLDEWVYYTQYPDAQAESLRRPKKAVIIGLLNDGRYIIWIDDTEIDAKWRRKKVNEENLSPID